MLSAELSMIGIGFTLGLMHALDADHVMAVSALSARKPSLWRTLRFSANWALGHGGVLLVSGVLLFGLGLSLPEPLQALAEASVGVLLIVLGLVCFWSFRQQRVRLAQHSHGDVVHTHWHIEKHGESSEHSESAQEAKQGQHAPVMVGVLHGLAGSAPALALVPAVAQGELWVSIAYLVLFSVGVMLSMMVFGLGLGSLQKKLAQRSARLFQGLRYGIAGASIALGSFWLFQAV